jgi:hypothetical protein
MRACVRCVCNQTRGWPVDPTLALTSAPLPLPQVCRTLRLLRHLQLHESCAQLFAQPGRSAAGAAQVPSRAHGVHVCRRLLTSSRLCAAARKQLLCAAAECNVLLAATFFMPMALVLLSTLARVAVLLRGLLSSCADAYNALLPLLASLPLGRGGMEGQDGVPQVVCLPELLRCDWGNVEDAATPVGVHLVRLDDGDAAPLVASPMLPLTVLESRSPAAGLDVASPAFVRVPVRLDAPQPQPGNTPAASPLNWLLGGTEMDQT